MEITKKRFESDIYSQMPDAVDLLPDWLSSLGTVTVEKLPPNYPPIWVNVEIKLNQPVKFTKGGWGHAREQGQLLINSHTGYIHDVFSVVAFLGKGPANGDEIIRLRMNLELSTRDLPEARHTLAELEACVRLFAQKLPNGVTD